MRIQILVLSLGLALLGVPIQGALAGSCSPCCAPSLETPCEGAAPCASLAAGSCCEAKQPLPPAPAKPSLDALAFQGSAVTLPSPRPAPPSPARVPAPDRIASPLRLSVVLIL